MKSSHLSCGLRLDLVAQLLTDAPHVGHGGLGGGVRPKSGNALHELLVDAVAAAVGLRAALRLSLREAGAAALESCKRIVTLKTFGKYVLEMLRACGINEAHVHFI